MRSTRATTAAAGVLASLAVSLLLWYVFRSPFVFLFVPFVPFFFRGERKPTRRHCPACGFETTDESFEYCPRDGRRLEPTHDDPEEA